MAKVTIIAEVTKYIEFLEKSEYSGTMKLTTKH